MAIDIRTTPSSASATGPGAPALPDVQVAQRTSPSVQQALAALGGGFGFGSPYKFSGYTAPGVGNAPRKPQGMYPNYTLGGQFMYDFGTGPSWSGGGPSFGSGGGGGGGGARDYNWMPDRQHGMNFAPNVSFGGTIQDPGGSSAHLDFDASRNTQSFAAQNQMAALMSAIRRGEVSVAALQGMK